MLSGLIFNIQKFCLNDGPGIRTTVFLKGCPLRCKWCHNPESHWCKPELLYNEDNCVNCGRCASICPQNAHAFEGRHMIHRKQCVSCGACADACAFHALELAGKEMGVEEIMDEVLKDNVFYDNSGGGITLSGGEPLVQADFSYALLKQAKENHIHTCIETCGYAKTEDILRIAEVTDLFLYDWKLTDAQAHKQYTGVSNCLIKDNLKAINAAGAKIVLRCPIIPGVNDNVMHLSGISELANSLENVIGIEIEPYHPLGTGKLQKLGKPEMMQNFETPGESQIADWIAQIKSQTKTPVKKA